MERDTSLRNGEQGSSGLKRSDIGCADGVPVHLGGNEIASRVALNEVERLLSMVGMRRLDGSVLSRQERIMQAIKTLKGEKSVDDQ